jgi:hypothetical protein
LEKMRRPDDWKRRLTVHAGIRPMRFDFDIPVATQGGSYHLEVEAPQGLQVTRGRIQTCRPKGAEPDPAVESGAPPPPSSSASAGTDAPGGQEPEIEQAATQGDEVPSKSSDDPSANEDAKSGDVANGESIDRDAAPPGKYVDRYTDKVSVSRTHLFIGDVERDYQVRAVVEFRPLAETSIRAATVSAAASTIVLLIVTVAWSRVIGNFGTVSALLFSVPVALAAWVSRAGEARTTSSAVLGIRVLAFLCGLYSLAGLIVLSLVRTCTTRAANLKVPPGGPSTIMQAAVQKCHTWWGVPWLLGLLTAAAAVILLSMLRALTYAARPPERRGHSDAPPPFDYWERLDA